MTTAAGRPNQRSRTRKDLLQAAARLLKEGRRPSLEEIAEAALVSRATAYRYFPTADAILFEVSLDVATPSPEALFADGGDADPVRRVQQVDTALHDVILANEAALRMVLVHSIQKAMEPAARAKAPARQNRRSPLIDKALEPVRGQLGPKALARLSRALALIIGPEGMVVTKDVLRLDDGEARGVKQWAIAALVEAALAEARRPAPPSRRARAGTARPQQE
ncbi:TetR family transcriptional regulator [Allostella sp. ATCC 35155]|nr:TetR family transcriptional regulator [Stella sp. ATCC 35155]